MSTVVAPLPPPPEKFSWSHFLLTLATIAPSLVTASLALADEAGTAPKTTTASDALHLATGVTLALGSSNPDVVNAASAASAIIDGVITAIATHKTA